MSLQDRVVAAALADVARGPVEGSDDDWITEHIIEPSFGSGHTPKGTQYCAMTVARWYRLAGYDDTAGMHSVGKILYKWAKRSRHRRRYTNVAKARDRRFPRPGDIVIHQDKPGGWHGHVMLCVAANPETGCILIAEGNHSKSMGPSGVKYYPGTLGEDLERRAGVGLRWLSVEDDYVSCWVRVSDG